jgi:hypothetical protein
LVLAAEPVLAPPIVGELRRHLVDTKDAQLMVIAPSLADSPLKHAMGDVDEGRERAERVLATSLDELERNGTSPQGRIGDADPILAIEDALAEFPADEIIVVTAPEGEGAYSEDEIFDRARAQFDQEVVRLAIGQAGFANAQVQEVERAEVSSAEADEREIEPASKNLPRLSARDIAGIVIAVVGTIVLIVLAAQCGGDEVQRDTGTGGVGSSGGCVFRYIAAGVMALANIAHVVGLFLFESIGYRGVAAKGFAWLSLVGTPVAIILSLLSH